MTNANSQPLDPLDLVPLPVDAVLLPAEGNAVSPREMVLEALQARLKSQNLNWKIGPALDLNNPQRLLSLNQIAVHLLTCGFTSDVIPVPLSHWYRDGAAPQLLVVGRIDEESQVVHIPGLLTGEEFRQWFREAQEDQKLTAESELEVPISEFKGGMERLLTFVQLLQPGAISRKELVGSSAYSGPITSVLDWLTGNVDEMLLGLGGRLIPATAGTFRSAVDANVEALAVLAIPMGLDDGQLYTGQTAQKSIERFQLLLIPSGTDAINQLFVRLIAEQTGDLLPERLTLQAKQGDWKQEKTSATDTALELVFENCQQPIEVKVSYPGSKSITLPALEMPQ